MRGRCHPTVTFPCKDKSSSRPRNRKDSVDIYERLTDSRPQVSIAASDGQDLYSGLIRIHILYHACEEGPIFGLGMINELARHGYRLSAGTLYPLLHGLEKKGLLRSQKVRAGRWIRREYHATPAGRRAFRTAKQRVSELFGEIFETR